MKLFTWAAIGLVGGGIAYLEYTKNPMFASLKAKYLPGFKGAFSIGDFYTPVDEGRVDAAISALHRRKLSDEAWVNEVEKYKLLSDGLFKKLDQLNSLSAQDAEMGEGRLYKTQLLDIAKLLNDMEDHYNRPALLSGEK